MRMHCVAQFGGDVTEKRLRYLVSQMNAIRIDGHHVLRQALNDHRGGMGSRLDEKLEAR
jgi:hypothetical protein